MWKLKYSTVNSKGFCQHKVIHFQGNDQIFSYIGLKIGNSLDMVLKLQRYALMLRENGVNVLLQDPIFKVNITGLSHLTGEEIVSK